MRLPHGYAGRHTVVVGDSTRRVLLNSGEDGGGCDGRKWRKAGAVGIEPFIVNRDVDAVVAHVAEGECGHITQCVLDTEAPLLVVRRMESSNLVVVGGSSKEGAQLILQALKGCPIVESRHDSRGGRGSLNVWTGGRGSVSPWRVVDPNIDQPRQVGHERIAHHGGEGVVEDAEAAAKDGVRTQRRPGKTETGCPVDGVGGIVQLVVVVVND